MYQSSNSNVLIGDSGFVGATLQKQTAFGALFRSNNIYEIHRKEFATVVCAAAPAQKWIANREPAVDRRNIESLIAHLKTVTCETFVLISTVDVFKNPIGVDEDTPVDEEGLNAYGLHRRMLEKFVENHFPNQLHVRLPGLIGPGLRKNVIYDFLNDNNLQAIDSRGVFQFYPMVNLWWDIQTALRAGLKLVHLTAEPISVAEVSEQGFGKPFDQLEADIPATYDLRTRHAAIFGGTGNYQYSKRETIQAVRAYAQSEPLMPKTQEGASA
ncbi:MAG: NAD(P)-dependent oxidoreductase [Glaciimonas sp.]|nr:NAD(P)-dependent oxidoreductase [Glaciimonas sp.]